MHRRLPIALPGMVAVAMLAALPACAPQPDDQVIGPEPTIGCCWGDAPDPGAPGFARVLRISSPAIASLPMSQEGWINGGRED